MATHEPNFSTALVLFLDVNADADIIRWLQAKSDTGQYITPILSTLLRRYIASEALMDLGDHPDEDPDEDPAPDPEDPSPSSSSAPSAPP